MNYCAEVYLNGPYPDPPDRFMFEPHVPIEVAQRCHGTDLAVDYLHTGRATCTETANVLIGGYFMGHHTGLCARHWGRLVLAIGEELREARGTDHWLLRAVIENYGPKILDQARDAANAQQKEAHRKYLIRRSWERNAQALEARLTDGPSVYFIQAGKQGPIKIGTAGNVLKRLDELQTGNPHRLRVRATLPGGRDREYEYHRLFADHRLYGEWFKPAPPIRAEIKAIRAIAAKGETDGALF